MEKIMELKNKIHKEYIPILVDKAKETNMRVTDFLNKDKDIDPNLFNDLYMYCHMSREEFKFLIYDISMKLTKEFNSICHPLCRKTPDLFYGPLIKICNDNLMIDITQILTEFENIRSKCKIKLL
jgi:hypothetical protein